MTRALFAILLLGIGVAAGDEPRTPERAERPLPHRRQIVLRLALDDGWRSQMLVRELNRDWTRPNAALSLSQSEQQILDRTARECQELQQTVQAIFLIRIAERLDVPSLDLPAAQIGHGPWQTIDRRAFAYETRPLRTLDWLARLYANEDPCERMPTIRIDETSYLLGYREGFSGPRESPLAPWEPQPIKNPPRHRATVLANVPGPEELEETAP